MMRVAISLGGSLIWEEDYPNIKYLIKFRDLILEFWKRGYRFGIVTGGGKLARICIEAAESAGVTSRRDLDLIGIKATWINAELLRSLFGEYTYPAILTSYDSIPNTNLILIGGGWKPGCSTDLDTVLLAEKMGADFVLNLTDVDGVYDKDPDKYPDAKMFRRLTWEEARRIVGNKWEPGAHFPFDPIACRVAEEKGIKVVIMNGRRLDEVRKLFEGKDFIGTIIE